MINDNSTPNSANKYDCNISKDIPYYEALHTEILEFAQCCKEKYLTWLDTGCGTGSFGCKITKKSLARKLILADPSPNMLEIARERNSEKNTIFYNSKTQDLQFENDSIDIITAIQAHHYENKHERKIATTNCFRMLMKNGLYITSENCYPSDETSTEIFLRYWRNYQIAAGKSKEEANNHMKRFNTAYFPISIDDHINLYKEIGFNRIEILWKSYMQVAFVMIKG